MANPLGATPGILVGAAVGGAASVALQPLFEPSRQKAWNQNANRVLDPGLLSRLVAQGGLELKDGRTSAQLSGYSPDKFDALVYLAQAAPDLALVLEMWRRGEIAEALVNHALAKAQIETQYWNGLKGLFTDRLSAPVIALAIVRGIMDDPGYLPVGPPTTEGKVKAFPKSPLNTLEEAQATGFDSARLFVETAIAGRPMAPESAASAVFRGILELVDYQRAIAEGDIRNEWAEAIFETTRQIPTAHDYVEGQLRGWIDQTERDAGAARHGMSADDTDLLFKITGRPLSFHQAWIGTQRGGVYDGPIDEIPDYFLHQLRQSNIRPEWYNLAWAQHATYPSYFVLRALLQAGTITAAEGEAYFLGLGWPPELAQKAAATYAVSSSSSTTATRAKSAQTAAISALHKSFLAGSQTPETAIALLEGLGIDAAEAGQVVGYWQHELTFVEKRLTPANIKKAYRDNLTTRDEAIADLVAQHFSVADANTYLSI